MVKTSIVKSFNELQYKSTRDGQMLMYKRAFCNFIDNLIREYGHLNINDGYSLHVAELPDYEKKLFLAHIIDAGLFEELTATPSLTQETFKEYKNEMQFYINEELDNVYHNDMYEMEMSR